MANMAKHENNKTRGFHGQQQANNVPQTQWQTDEWMLRPNGNLDWTNDPIPSMENTQKDKSKETSTAET